MSITINPYPNLQNDSSVHYERIPYMAPPPAPPPTLGKRSRSPPAPGRRGQGVQGRGRVLNRVERLLQVRQDVADRLQPDRQPHVVRGHPGGRLLLGRELGVGGARRVDRQ